MTKTGGARRLSFEWWFVAILSSAIVLFFVIDRSTARLDTLAYDLLLRLDTEEPDPRILIVAVDEQSVQQMGSWPWPRDMQARLVDAINRSRPQAIAYDILLLEPRSGDPDLGVAMAKGAPTFVPLLLDVPGTNGAPFDPLPPVAQVERGAKGTGHVNLTVDPDGRARRVDLAVGSGEKRWPHLMVLMRQAAEPGAPPLQAHDRALLLPYAGAPGHFPTIGAAALMRGEFPAELMRDRLVLVGVTAQGVGDRYATPRGDNQGVMPGVEIQAHLLNGLLSGKLASEASFGTRLAAALLPLWILLAVFRALKPTPIMILLAAMIALIIFGTAGAFLGLRVWIPPVPAFAGLLLAYPLWAWRRLAAVNAYMSGELASIRNEPDLLSPSAPPPASDPFSRQAFLLQDAITRMRDMRRFVSDSLQQIPDPIFVVGLDGGIILANEAASTLLEALKMPADRIETILAALQPVAELTDGPKPAEQTELASWPPSSAQVRREAVAPNGRWFDIWITPRAAANGHKLGWIVRMIDVTAIKRAQRQRDDMLQFLSHDMRSPQASILAVLANAGPADIGDAVRGRIENYANRTLKLADDFVQLARAEMLRYRSEPVSLPDVLLDAIDDVWPQVTAKKLQVETRGEDENFLVSGERSLLTRALINLLDNAIRFSPEGGRLHCTLEAQTQDGLSVVACRITDEGEGISNEHLCKLFERFEQAPRQISGRRDGVGLGLSLVHTVVTRHNGRISCQSRPGEGTSFTLLLPLINEIQMLPDS